MQYKGMWESIRIIGRGFWFSNLTSAEVLTWSIIEKEGEGTADFYRWLKKTIRGYIHYNYINPILHLIAHMHFLLNVKSIQIKMVANHFVSGNCIFDALLQWIGWSTRVLTME